MPATVLGVFPKLLKATVGFVMSFCPSVRTEQRGSHLTDIEETWYLSFFQKSVEKIQVLTISDKTNGYFTLERFNIYGNISLNSS
jgi:hypothetical protein